MSTKPILLAVASFLALGAPGAAACQLVKVTEAPLFALGTHYAISVVLNDATRPIIVDTGAATTLLIPPVIDEFKLKTDPLAEPAPVFGMGQVQAIVHQNAIAAVFGIGDLIYRDRSTVVGEMDFGKSPENKAIGLLGDDILSKFDVEFDFPSGRLTFYQTFQCYESFMPWTGDYVIIPFDHHDKKLVIDLMLNHERTRAIVDTGNNASFISRRASALWEVGDVELGATLGRQSSPFNGGTSSDVKTYTFETVEVGGNTYRQMKMNVVDLDLHVGSADLGLDFWRTRKVWISYSRNWMFIADRSAAASLAYPVRDETPAPDEARAPTAGQLAAGSGPPSALPPPPR